MVSLCKHGIFRRLVLQSTHPSEPEADVPLPRQTAAGNRAWAGQRQDAQTGNRPSIAVVILTHNEEANLHHCLASVQWADELLIVDSCSEDGTLAIAQAWGVRTLSHKMQPFIISEQRNYALDAGNLAADWILFIDADEIVTDALRRELCQTLATAPTEVVGYRLTPKFMFLGRWLRHAQGYPLWHDRLLRRGQVRFGGGVWESFDLVNQTHAVIGYLQEPYIHNSINKGIGEWLTKHSRYATVEALDILVTLGYAVDDTSYTERTTRKRLLRTATAFVWPLRPLLRFLVMYIWRRGFLDGFPGLLYSLMIAWYEFVIVLKVIEFRRRRQGLPI